MRAAGRPAAPGVRSEVKRGGVVAPRRLAVAGGSGVLGRGHGVGLRPGGLGCGRAARAIESEDVRSGSRPPAASMASRSAYLYAAVMALFIALSPRSAPSPIASTRSHWPLVWSILYRAVMT